MPGAETAASLEPELTALLFLALVVAAGGLGTYGFARLVSWLVGAAQREHVRTQQIATAGQVGERTPRQTHPRRSTGGFLPLGERGGPTRCAPPGAPCWVTGRIGCDGAHE